MLEKQTIQINTGVPGFRVGKIAAWKEFLLLFDSFEPRCIPVLPGNPDQALPPVDLRETAGIKQIDAVLVHRDQLLVFDFLNTAMFQLSIETLGGESSDSIQFKTINRFPLDTGSQIVAAVPWQDKQDNIILLDKNHSMLRVLGPGFNETKTVGSRMGYICGTGQDKKRRLGFEFPEDLIKIGDRLVVSDSGNKRLVVLDSDLKQESVINLPEFPFRILLTDAEREIVMVSDFNCSVMAVSLAHGFIFNEPLPQSVDFFPSAFIPADPTGASYCLTGTENKEELQLLRLSLPTASIEEMAVQSGNNRLLMQLYISRGETGAARKLLDAHPELLLDFARETEGSDPSLNPLLSKHIEESFHRAIQNNDSIKTTVDRLSRNFFDLYKRVPDSDDKEAFSIERENIRHTMFLEIKKFRANLHEINALSHTVKHHAKPAAELKKLMDNRFDSIGTQLHEQLKHTENALDKIDEKAALEYLIKYWFLAEEEQVWFRDRDFKYKKLLEDTYILIILDDFYFHLGKLYLKRHNHDLYTRYCDREITMYPDKAGVIDHLVRQLIQLDKYDDVFRLLKKFPDPNRENVNFYYYQVYRRQLDLDNAFLYLKKELDLFPNRYDLIPLLILLDRMSPQDAESYIDRLLVKPVRSIDVYYNAANAFYAIGNYEKSLEYLDKELASFPENQRAIETKLNLLLLMESSPTEEMAVLAASLTGDSAAIQKSRYFYLIKDYKKSWTFFHLYLKTNFNYVKTPEYIFLLESMGRVPAGSIEPKSIKELESLIRFDQYKKEFQVYLSFLRNNQKLDLEQDIASGLETYAAETYLSAYSTRVPAYDFYLGQLQDYEKKNQWEFFNQLAEMMLKYYPGDETLFQLIENAAPKMAKRS